MPPSRSDDLRTRIAGALTYLASKDAAHPARSERSLRFAMDLLAEADQALARKEQPQKQKPHSAPRSPERSGTGRGQHSASASSGPSAAEVEAAQKEAAALRKQLNRAERKIVDLELTLSVSRGEVEALEAVTTEEQRARRELELRVADIDKKLMTDDDAFGKFMDAALDQQERDQERRDKRR